MALVVMHKRELNKLLIYYNFNRIDWSLRKGLKGRTPFDAFNSWFQNIVFRMVQRG